MDGADAAVPSAVAGPLRLRAAPQLLHRVTMRSSGGQEERPAAVDEVRVLPCRGVSEVRGPYAPRSAVVAVVVVVAVRLTQICRFIAREQVSPRALGLCMRACVQCLLRTRCAGSLLAGSNERVHSR